jgi:hypothetical protein
MVMALAGDTVKATTFLLIGIATLQFVLSGSYASRFEWALSGASLFLGCAMLCFAAAE